MAEEPLLTAAARIADGDLIDWGSVTSTLRSDDDKAIAEELAALQQIAVGHRQLHQLLPVSSDTPPHLMPDRARWGHLDLLNVVGRGSYGMVYRAWDTRLERLVALKLFHGASDPETVMREGRMLARVRHENVVTIYGADVIDGVAGIWMELIHGRTLDHIVKHDGPLEPLDAASVGADVACALGAVHDAALLHCDVKAQNVVREENGRVVLMDLGAGRLAPEARDLDEKISDIAGTPRYMAPELFKAGTTATRETDIYSLGVLVYYLVSGKYPVDGKTFGELKRAHEARQSVPLADARRGLPTSLTATVARALDRDPAQRPTSAADVQTALSAVTSAAPTVRSPQYWLVAAAVAAAAVIGLAQFVWQRTPSPASPPSIRSIAVLPIRNLTGDASKQYVADGLTEVLISNLARVRTLRVPSYAAIGTLRGGDVPGADTAKRLGVQLMLAGSISQAGDDMRLNVTLVDDQGTAVWGDEITRAAAGMLSAQADLNRRLLHHLALDGADSPHLVRMSAMNAGAQDAYLRALSLRVTSPSAQQEAARSFREAVELDPGLADGWAQLSLIESMFAERADLSDRARGRALARELAERALTLDSTEPNAYAALGTLQFYTEWNFAAAEHNLRTAVELSPTAAFARSQYAMLLSALGRFPEAVRTAEEGAQLEPTVALRTTALGTVYYYAHDYERASDQMRRALSITPDFGVAHFGLGRIASAQGRHDVAIAEIERALAQSRISPWLVELARTYAAAGRHADAQRTLAEVAARQRAGDRVSSDNFAYIAIAEGRTDDAFEMLKAAVDRREAATLWLAVDPRTDPIRDDPRFNKLLSQAGLR